MGYYPIVEFKKVLRQPVKVVFVTLDAGERLSNKK